MRGAFARAFAVTLCVLLGGCEASSSGASTVLREYVAMVRGEVDVVGGRVSVFAAQAGHLVTTRVQLGQQVNAGEVLATIESRALESDLALRRANADAARARLRAATVQRASANGQLDRLLQAQAADAASSQSVDEARTVVASLLAQEQVAVAEVAASVARLKAAEQSIAELQVRAPVAGELVQIHARTHQRVSGADSEPLFVILPDGPRIVRAEVNEEFASQVHSGMSAQIVVEGAVESVFPARAVRVSGALRRTALASDGEETIDARVLDCEVDVDAPTLRVGQRVLVRFPGAGA